jgi:hypothetical protein
MKGDRSARPTEKLGNRALGSTYLLEVDLVLALGAVVCCDVLGCASGGDWRVWKPASPGRTTD